MGKEALSGLSGKVKAMRFPLALGLQEEKPMTNQPSPRYARVLQHVTVEFHIDLDAHLVYQVLTDFTTPLSVEPLTGPGEDRPCLSVDEQQLALELTRNSDIWPAWTMIDSVTPRGETLRCSQNED
jgi:hypothetical protein